MQTLTKILIVLLFPILAYSADTTYYAKDGGAGAFNGTDIDNAWRLSDINNSANWSSTDDATKIDPGDTLVLSGAWAIGTSTFTVQGSGTSSNWITIDGDDGVNPAVDFAPTETSGSVTIKTNGKDYIDFVDLDFDGAAGRALIQINAGSTGIKVQSSALINDGGYGIDIRGGSEIEILDNTITGGDCCDGVLVRANDGAISDVEIYRNDIIDWFHSSISIVGDDYNVTDIKAYNNKMTLPDEGYGRAFEIGSVAGSTGTTTYLYIYDNYVSGMRAPSQIAGSSHIEVYNNIFYDAKNCCQNFDDAGCTKDGDGTDNRCSRTSSDFFGTGQHWVFHTEQGDVDQVDFYNNILYNSSEAALQLRMQAANTLSNLRFANNIFYGGVKLADDGDSPSGSSETVVDHIISTYRVNGSLAGVEFHNNVVYDTESVTDIGWSGSYATVDDFDNADPAPYAIIKRGGNINDDPDLVNPGGGDFTLEAASPCIDKGYNLNDDDYDNCWSPASSYPPTAVTHFDQDTNGQGWEIGNFCTNSFKPASVSITIVR